MASTSTYSASTSNHADSVHLLVLVHGMWGNPTHLAEMARVAKEEKPELHVLLAETNREDSTYDGIDWGGERVAEEIMQEINRLQKEGKYVRQFSITGYSLGGLVSRYVVGILSQRGLFSTSPESDSSRPISMIPMNFNTVATPHLGLVRYPTIFSSVAHTLGPRLLSRTGEQFYLKDKWSHSGRPLLDVMSDPHLVFYQALTQFKHVRIFANALNDMTVPYVTAAIELEDPFVDHDTNGLEVQFHTKYYPLLESYIISSSPKPKPKTERKKKKVSFLPPFLQRPFPLNIVIYTALPLLIPVFIVLVFVRFTKASRSSRARIRLLESNSESGSLMKALSHLERRIGDAVADAIDDPASVLVSSTSTPSSSSPMTSGTSTPAPPPDPLSSPPSPKSKSKSQPIFTPLQTIICARLNAIPHLKKERAFIDNVRNSHAPIVSRDIKNFEFHKVGEGVLRFWAEKLVV